MTTGLPPGVDAPAGPTPSAGGTASPALEAAPAGALPVLGAPGIAEGSGCHGGAERLRAAADAAGKGAVLEQLVADYPRGPHDQPQSMCPAFGSLRVGLRMRRTASVLSGSACCVYGLTFTSHFYGARRTVGYVPFNSETLVTGQLFEDIRRAMEELADPEQYDAIIMTNLCIPTASGVPLDLLPKEINGVRIVGIDVPGFGVPTHAEAKDVLAGAVLKYAREEAERGAVPKPRGLIEDRPTITLLGELFPVDPVGINALLAPMGMAVGTVVPTREWRELYAALDCEVVGAVHPFYAASVRQFRLAGRPIVGSGPVGVEGTAAWLEAVGAAAGIPSHAVAAARDAALAGIRGALSANPIHGRISMSGYEGSELLVARVLVEAGAEVPYVGTACPRTEWSAPDLEWLQARGTHVQFRASVEQDVAAFRDVNPDLVIGTTPVVQKAKESGIPGLYYTNLISARPIFGPAGAGSLAQTLRTAIGGRERLGRMRAFFEGVGTGHTAGYGFDGIPERKLSAKERNAAARGGRAVTGKRGADEEGGQDIGGRDTDASTDLRQRADQARKAKGSLQVVAAGAATSAGARPDAPAAGGAD
jgi:3,8-divinyl chlorophyllide a/chlorophyllide a reductase subunit Y